MFRMGDRVRFEGLLGTVIEAHWGEQACRVLFDNATFDRVSELPVFVWEQLSRADEQRSVEALARIIADKDDHLQQLRVAAESHHLQYRQQREALDDMRLQRDALMQSKDAMQNRIDAQVNNISVLQNINDTVEAERDDIKERLDLQLKKNDAVHKLLDTANEEVGRMALELRHARQALGIADTQLSELNHKLKIERRAWESTIKDLRAALVRVLSNAHPLLTFLNGMLVDISVASLGAAAADAEKLLLTLPPV